MAWRDDVDEAPTTPALESIAEARTYVADLTDDEYAIARVVQSEYGSGSPTEIACIGDCILNEAQDGHRSVVDHVTAGSGEYGEQGTAGSGGRKRPVSSRQAPAPRHVAAALMLTRRRLWGLLPPPARGVAKGGRMFFDPKTQAALHNRGDPKYAAPLIVLQSWTFDQKKDAGQIPDGTPKGKQQREWVGPIRGVDAWQLMIFRPATAQQKDLYHSAVRVIESQGLEQGGPSPAKPLLELALVVAAASAASWLLSGHAPTLL